MLTYTKKVTPPDAAAYDAEVEKRRELCGSCENKTTVAGVDLCSLCLCVIRGKTALRGAHCPINKW